MRRWLIWSAYALVWTTLLLLPGSAYTTTGVADWQFSYRTLVTKTIHLMGYAAFAFLSGWVMVAARYRWMMLFLVMAHGTVSELIQLHVGRNGCLEDVGLNNIGVVVGVLVGWKWWTAR